jgi:hypothetical protein
MTARVNQAPHKFVSRARTLIPFSFVLSVAILCAASRLSRSEGRRSPAPSANPEQTVPQGTIIPLRINNTINSRTAYSGEAVYGETTFPVTLGDQMLIPPHSYVKGYVTGVVQPGRLMGRAQLSLRFDSLTLPNGTTRPIKCIVYSLAGERLQTAKGGDKTTGQVQANTTPSAEDTSSVIDASGLGGVSALSAASAGVGGLVLLLTSHSKNILLRPGTTLEIQLTRPLDLAGPPPRRQGPPQLHHRP